MDKMTVHEVSRLTGVSIRTLQYYDKTGLLPASEHTDAGYRLYDEKSLERLQQILLFRELEFPLKDIKEILDSPGFDRKKALARQTELLILRKQQLERLIALAQKMQDDRASRLDFSAFDKAKIKEYAENARKEWGHTPQYEEYMSRHRTDDMTAYAELIRIFARFGEMRLLPPDDSEVRREIEILRDFITENFYECTDGILLSLADMYVNDPRFRKTIDDAGGEGTAEFVRRAVEHICRQR
ncbi:MAG: MerR family transcriptional regulator [Oscillospiraceae bacterium]|nr:MerR family transcriptional regulator [Oscillospiraceae bacterium]